MMMKEFLLYVGFSAPIISSLSCLVMLVLYRLHHIKTEENPLYRMLIAYFGLVGILWGCSMIYVYYPVFYTYINQLYYIGLFWGQVVFYQFIYTLTHRPGERRFSIWHYLIPLIIVGIFAVWSIFVPFDVQLRIVTSRGEIMPGYEAYSYLFTSRLIFVACGISCIPYWRGGDCWTITGRYPITLPIQTARHCHGLRFCW